MAFPARLFCDTSFFYACFDPHDVNHEQAKQISEEPPPPVPRSMSPGMSSVKQRRSSLPAILPRSADSLTEVKPDLRIVNYGATVRTEAEQIFRRCSRDRKLSFCDAISFVVVTTLLDDIPSLAFDTDFHALGS
jgi:predicted nucleic acid-binding protein